MNCNVAVTRQVLGSYENRIRNFSSSERVFEFFASVTNEK